MTDRRKEPNTRPGYHIIPFGGGWINDPCGPGYDPATETYHIFYQWNPKGCEWGNMSWGHATSKDLLHWKYTGPQPALKPDTPYDKEGVFTGCFCPVGLKGESKKLTIFYSSICGPSFSWERPPYPRGSAGISVATSSDGGTSWQKIADNPIVKEEPPAIDVTGYRDPYVAEWDSMDAVLDHTKSQYAVVGGGIHGKGPAIFLYQVNPQNLSTWTYMGMLFHTSIGFRPSKAWNGDAGVNWECPSFATLKTDTVSREFIIFGSEGGSERDHILKNQNDSSLPQRVLQWCMWVSGTLSKRQNGEPEFEYKFGGLLDHGCYYAASTFDDIKNNRRVVWGWIVEDDVTIERCRAKGWTGCLSMPREIFLMEYRDVVGSSKTNLQELASFEYNDEDGHATMRTLGIRPLPEITQLRSGEKQDARCPIHLSQSASSSKLFSCNSQRWQIEVSVLVENCSKVGLQIHHGRTGEFKTEIYFSPLDEQIVVIRPQRTNSSSNTLPEFLRINNREERGSHTLFKFAEGANTQDERLRLQVFRDGQVLEIFANERFALSTMIYIDCEDGDTNDQAYSFVECDSPNVNSTENGAIVEDAQMWEMIDGIFGKGSSKALQFKSSVHSSL